MCGIFGFYSERFSLTADAVERISAVQRVRGPDSFGSHSDCDGRLWLAHQRLSILDLSDNGRQPFLSPDGDIALTYNGEIYNHLDLRRGLRDDGTPFRSTSDTETLLRCYRQYGDDHVTRLNGMFAYAVYDRRERALKLYRDRVGIKPLLFYFDGETLIFASDLRVIEACAKEVGIVLSIDRSAIYDFFHYLYVPAPKTMYHHVFKLLPGDALTLRLDDMRLRSRPYWRLSPDEYLHDPAIASERLVATLTQGILSQYLADVPVGVFLSGGLDSSTIVSIATERFGPQRSYSLGFTDPSYDESGYAREVADHFHGEHISETLGDITPDAVHEALASLDEPLADTAVISNYYVAKLAARSVKVVLGGEGSDEMFGGYLWYDSVRRVEQSPLRRLRPGFAALSRVYPTRLKGGVHVRRLGTAFYDLLFLMNTGLREPSDLFSDAFIDEMRGYDRAWHYRENDRPDLPVMSRLQYLDFKTYLPNDILMKVDRTTMAHSLEARVPFLDHDLVDLAFGIDFELKNRGGELKHLLKQAVAPKLPPSVLRRRKKGFSTPIARWHEIGGWQVDASRYRDILRTERVDAYHGYKLLVLDTWLQARGIEL